MNHLSRWRNIATSTACFATNDFLDDSRCCVLLDLLEPDSDDSEYEQSSKRGTIMVAAPAESTTRP